MRRVLRTAPKGALLSVALHALLLVGLLGFRPEQRRTKPRRPPVSVTLVTKAKAAEPRPQPPAPLPKQAAPARSKKLAAPALPKRVKRTARRVARAADKAPARPSSVLPVEAARKTSTSGQPRRFTVSLSATISSGGVSVPATLGGTGDITSAPARSTRKPGKSGDGEARPPVAPATTVMPTLVSQPSRSQMRAAYPPGARKEGIEGDVRMKILVSATGQVTRVRLLRAAGNGFDEAARQLVRMFRFRAARRDGKAVAVWIPWTYKFRLSS